MKCWGPASLSSKSGGIRQRCASSLDTEECLGAFAMQKLATILSTVWTYSEDWRDHMAVLMGWASVWEVYEAIATHQGHTNISSINLSWIGSINPVMLVGERTFFPRYNNVELTMYSNVQRACLRPITVWVSLLREHPVCSYNFLGSLWSLSVRARSDRSPGPTWSQASSHISVVEERLVVGELESILDHALALWKPDDSSELWSAEARDRRGVGAARTQCRKGTRPAARTPWRSPRPWRPPRSARARRP